MARNDADDEISVLTEEDLKEFFAAKTLKEQFGILLKHSEKNKKFIEKRRKQMESNQNAVSEEELEKQFEEFCHTKGIVAKFKVAFEQMGEDARAQREHDKATFEEQKKKSAEENKDFVELLHTKGFKAKCRLVIENIKRGAQESKEKTKSQREAAKSAAHGTASAPADYTAEQLSAEFNAFLKERGLGEKYSVQIVEE